MDTEEALKALMDGNQRYRQKRAAHARQTPDHARSLKEGQNPFAVILGCSDSRIVPEIVFDQGLGDLFVVRVAGNVVSPHGLASIEYAVDHLGVSLVMVLGHEYCGAVAAVHALLLTGESAPGHMVSLVDELKPALDEAKLEGGDVLEMAMCRNVERMVERLRDSEPILAPAVRAGNLRIVGGRYDFEDGDVRLLMQ